jgi:hypothetical protein
MAHFNGYAEQSDRFQDMNDGHAARKAESASFVPAPLTGCICEGNVTIDGVEYELHTPCCLVAGHGLHSYQTERRALDGTARAAGKVHAAHRSEQ